MTRVLRKTTESPWWDRTNTKKVQYQDRGELWVYAPRRVDGVFVGGEYWLIAENVPVHTFEHFYAALEEVVLRVKQTLSPANRLDNPLYLDVAECMVGWYHDVLRWEPDTDSNE
jgi:hypothetical protein